MIYNLIKDLSEKSDDVLILGNKQQHQPVYKTQKSG